MRAPGRHVGTAVGVLVAALLVTGCTTAGQPRAGARSSAPSPSPTAAFHGLEPAGERPVRPSFVLRDTEGNTFDFRAQTAGQPTLLYFGYTSCPDECPTAMADIAAALRTTASDVRGKTRVVFVTTDPTRDTAPRLRRFLDQWSRDFIGLRGSQAEVDAAQRAVGLAPARKGGVQPTLPGRPDQHVDAEGTAPHKHDGPLGYGIAHADLIFAFDAADRLPVFYPGGVRPSDIAADLPLLASGEAT